ncbi:hypothetical protein [Simiduia agarivorans]|uniref:Lipoprotein n=1 Tax=Simiduia agarivorans (strain DSM 21679 / JCM 13881 / BCRC 17597 / SA1) TaxID=1117647 RepID=K4KXP7_SIMAS|nr:hypothetical protein [Simiduia agarivorans]AFU98677.1 hypothetical protein M5M_07420 [Simiduia agarivorans SA1 = DSM 21679]
MNRMHGIVFLGGLVLTGCNGMSFSTNVGEYVTGSVKSTAVVEYSKEDIVKYNADALGLIEASECQPKPGDAPVSKQSLVKAMKLQVLDKGGNGLVVERCGTEPTAACNEYLTCWGMAYSVPYKQSRP